MTIKYILPENFALFKDIHYYKSTQPLSPYDLSLNYEKWGIAHSCNDNFTVHELNITFVAYGKIVTKKA